MISREEVQNIAKLARIELTDQEIEKMQKDLSSILDYFNVLKKAKKTEGDDYNKKIEMNTREDVVHDSMSKREDLIAAFPDKKDDYIKVKQVLQ